MNDEVKLRRDIHNRDKHIGLLQKRITELETQLAEKKKGGLFLASQLLEWTKRANSHVDRIHELESKLKAERL